MPLLTLFPFLNLITGRFWVYLAIIGMAGSFVGGYWVKSKFEAAKQVTAVNLARAQERDAAHIGNQAEHQYLANLRNQRNEADDKIKRLEKRLAKVKPCPVPVPDEWLREPKRVPATAPDASRPGPAGADVDTAPVADAKDVVLTCEKNRLQVHVPNSAQIEATRQWYRDLQKELNR